MSKINVCYIYREKRATGFSIEEVFKNIRSHLPDFVEQSEYTLPLNTPRWKHILLVRKLKADIFHITGDCHYVALGLPRDKTILTIHDLGSIEEGLKGWKKIPYLIFWWFLPLMWLKHFTCISEFTRSRIKKRFSSLVNDIVVIHNPLSERFKPSLKGSPNKVPEILQIGGGKNKNITGLIELAKNSKCKLLLVRPRSKEIEETLGKLNIEFEWFENVTDAEIVHLYNRSDLVYFVSTYEGFGLPIIEAQAVGRPVLTSTVASMPEIYGSNLYLSHPSNTAEIVHNYQQLIQQSNWMKEVQRGLKNVKRFKPDSISRQYADTYKELME